MDARPHARDLQPEPGGTCRRHWRERSAQHCRKRQLPYVGYKSDTAELPDLAGGRQPRWPRHCPDAQALRRFLPLHVAFTITTGLAVVGVQVVASVVLFHEMITPSQWLGTLLVIVGIGLIGLR